MDGHCTVHVLFCTIYIYVDKFIKGKTKWLNMCLP